MDAIKAMAKELKSVYSPLQHRKYSCKTCVKELGFEHVYVVKEQELCLTENSLSAIPTRKQTGSL